MAINALLAPPETLQKGGRNACEGRDAENTGEPGPPRWRRVVDAGPVLQRLAGNQRCLLSFFRATDNGTPTASRRLPRIYLVGGERDTIAIGDAARPLRISAIPCLVVTVARRIETVLGEVRNLVAAQLRIVGQ
jgi:hypothetical protein